METKWYDMTEQINQADIEEIAHFLRTGEVVAIPTETVYGLAADATNETAVEKIFIAKGRPSDNPLIVHVATKAQLYRLVKDVPAYVDTLIDTFSPGPITYVLPSAGKVATNVSAGLATVGVRIPNHQLALEILRMADVPLAAPSANRSTKPSPTNAHHVYEDLAGKIKAIVDGGTTNVGLESTVIDCTGPAPIILRPGAITRNDIAQVVGACEQYVREPNVTIPKSPGMKYVHYAPDVPLLLVSQPRIVDVIQAQQAAGKQVALIYESASLANVPVARKIYMPANEAVISKQLYELLRSITRTVADVLIFEYQAIDNQSAVLDRLKRAATKIIM